jgi:hypothetical protein
MTKQYGKQHLLKPILLLIDQWVVQGLAMESDDFQVAVLMDQVEYKIQKNYGLSVVKCHLIYVFF